MKEEASNLLWTNYKNGQDDSLEALYKEYADDLYSYGLKICGDNHLVKDCVQDVFIKLIEKRKTLQITPRIHIYLYKSFRNQILEKLRSKNRKLYIITKLSKFETGYQKHAEQLIIETEEEDSIRKKLQSTIDKLSDRQKEIIYLKYTEGFSYDEIAELLKIDKASARTLLYRILKTMKELLNNDSMILLVFIGIL